MTVLVQRPADAAMVFLQSGNMQIVKEEENIYKMPEVVTQWPA